MPLSELGRAAAVLSALAAPSRLELLVSVLRCQDRQEVCSIRTLAAAADRSQKALVKDVIRLQECGLLTLDGDRVSADLSVLRTTADAVDTLLPISPLLAEEPDLARFFQHGRLAAIPENAPLRQRVARLLVRLIPPGRRLPEAEVNRLLAQVHDDYASLRRLLVDMGLLSRRASRDYQRVDVS